MARGRGSASGTEYRVRVDLAAPLDFCFAWCTDYDAGDARREGERYERRVLSRTPRRVVFEDLEGADGGGWRWVRHTVSLRAPDRWHSESVGSHRTASLDYRLSALGPTRTRLELRWRRWPTELAGPRPPRSTIEGTTRRLWGRLARELARDYRRSRRRATP